MGFIPAHGGYEELLSFRTARIVYDATVFFCDRFVGKYDRTREQMIQAARSGKHNILEGSQASGTSKETEIKLVNVARASLEELLEDYRDFLRSCGRKIAGKRRLSGNWARGRIRRMRLIGPILKRALPKWWRTSSFA
jgi:four helix bundle protein